MTAKTQLTDVEIGALVASHWPGLAKDQVPLIVAIVRAESGGRPDAMNSNKNGSRDWGLFQINDVNWQGQPAATRLDPAANTAKAFEVYKRQGLGAWVAYKNGKHLPFLPAAKAALQGAGSGLKGPIDSAAVTAAGKDGGSSVNPLSIASGVGGAAIGVLGAGPAILKNLDPGEAIAGAFASLNETLAKFFNNFALWIVAVVLIVLGIIVIGRRPIGTVVGMAGPGKVTKALGVAKAVTGK